MRNNPDPAAANRDALIYNLRLSFRTPAKAGRDSITLLQARYVKALSDVAGFLSSSGAGEDIVRRFIELADAIGQLLNGTVADVVRPATPQNRPPDGIVRWSERHEVVIGLHCIVKSKRMTLKNAAKYVAKKYPLLAKLQRNSDDDLAGAMLSWRSRIRNGEAPASDDMMAHERKFFEATYRDLFAEAERVLGNIAKHAEKI